MSSSFSQMSFPVLRDATCHRLRLRRIQELLLWFEVACLALRRSGSVVSGSVSRSAARVDAVSFASSVNYCARGEV